MLGADLAAFSLFSGSELLSASAVLPDAGATRELRAGRIPGGRIPGAQPRGSAGPAAPKAFPALCCKSAA